MKQDQRVKEILDSISELFGDTSVPKEKTLEWMEEIQSALEDNIAGLKEDIEREES